jgi:hypothetical protein
MKTMLTLIAAGLVAAAVAAAGTFAAKPTAPTLKVKEIMVAKRLSSGQRDVIAATCPSGWAVTGGGYETGNGFDNGHVIDSGPSGADSDGNLYGTPQGPAAWRIQAENTNTNDPSAVYDITADVVCAQLSP